MAIRMVLTAVAVLSAGMAVAAETPLRLSGDVRVGALHGERVARDGSDSSDDELRGRLRVALDKGLGERWTFRARVASRVGSEQDGMRAYLRGSAPEPSGAALGDTTLDEFYLERGKGDGQWWWRVGRFQSKFDLQGVAAKSLDRNDSPNMDVNWTDGVHVRYDGVPGWRVHAVVEHNASRYPSSLRRAPLDFSQGDAGPGAFLGIEAAQRAGPLVQRMLSLTWMPDALADQGPAIPARRDYVALTARAALAFAEAEAGRRVLLGMEAGHAFNTPRRSLYGLDGGGRVGGNAWQASLNFEQFLPGHSLGFVVGRAQAGWLLSPDFRNNDRLAEVRYQWRIDPNWSIEARVREREEDVVPGTALRPRRDRDAYLRLSGRFSGP